MNLDADLHHADWLKHRWDLPTELRPFLAHFPTEADLERFMKLPAAAAMPPGLRMELAALHVMPMAKYNENHDEAGRFASGSSSSFTAAPVARLTALHGAYSDWSTKGLWHMSSAEIAAKNDPRLNVTGYAGSILGGDPVAARWQGEHLDITASGWDASTPETREFLVAHEVSHAAAADVLANLDSGQRDALLAPFRNTEGGATYSERALVFPGEFDDMARGPEEMLSDVGATLLTQGRDVLDQRFEGEKKFDIGAEPADARLQALYDTVAASLDRVGNPPPATVRKDFNEADHPRDEAGRFTSAGGGTPKLVQNSPDRDTPEWHETIADIRAQGPGNCYEAAATLMMNDYQLGLKNPRIIHATVMGRGQLEGIRFGHAWLEADAEGFEGGPPFRNAYDFASGNSVVIPDALYRHLGEAEDIHEYTQTEAMDHMIETMHYGPWEGDPPLVGSSDWKNSGPA